MRYRFRGSGPTSGKAMRIVPLVFLGLGAGLLAAAVLVAVILNNASVERTESTMGTVVEVTEQTTQNRDSDGGTRTSTTYCPTVSYTVSGNEYSFDADVCTGSREANEVGGEIAVNYDPDNPADAAVDSWTQRWLAPLILGGIGIVFAGVGAIVYTAVRSGKLRSPRQRQEGARERPTGQAPQFQRPDFPPAREGTTGYDKVGVDMLVSRIEHAYGQLAAGEQPALTTDDIATPNLATTATSGTGYDIATVDMYLNSVRNDLERTTSS